MPTSDAEFVQRIKKIVSEHYASGSGPLLLSRVGLLLNEQDGWPENRAGRTLKQLIETLVPGDLELLRDERSPAYVVVAPPEKRTDVQAAIQQRRAARAEASFNLSDLAWPVLLAFCIREDGPVYLRRNSPFRFLVEPPVPDLLDQYVVVEPEYRMPGLRVHNIDQVSQSDRVELENRIKKWALAHGFELEHFFRAKQAEASSSEGSALDRLVGAQDPAIARKLLIPADVAALLAKSR